MRGRLPNRLMTGTAIAAAALLVAGCGGQARGMPPAIEHAPQATADALPAAPAAPAAPLAGLDTRVQQAAADAAASGAAIHLAVLDRSTGQRVSSRADTAFPIASVVKVFIADDLLHESDGPLSAADRKALDVMLRASDDGAAQTFWNRNGQSAIIERIVARYGLAGTTPPYNNAKWDVTTSTANDLVTYYEKLLNGAGGLPREQADVIITNLAQHTPAGVDGYPQRFGIPDGLSGEPVAVKQGWFCCWNGGNQLHVSTGTIGVDHRYVMAIGSLDPTGEAAARENITQAVRTVFPGGKI